MNKSLILAQQKYFEDETNLEYIEEYMRMINISAKEHIISVHTRDILLNQIELSKENIV